MSETAGAGTGTGGVARLDELAAVTREYAKDSRTAYGAAFVVTGAVLLAILLAELIASSPWAPLGYLLLPVVWLLSLGAARAFYQRKGSVIEPDQRVRGRRWILALVYLSCAAGLVQLSTRALRDVVTPEGLGAPVLGSLAVGILALVAVPLLAAELIRGRRDGGLTLAIVLLASPLGGLASPFPVAPGGQLERLNQAQALIRGLLLVIAAVIAVALVVAGVRDHGRARVLERRLRALREAA